jgi:hypothetical protein
MMSEVNAVFQYYFAEPLYPPRINSSLKVITRGRVNKVNYSKRTHLAFFDNTLLWQKMPKEFLVVNNA